MSNLYNNKRAGFTIMKNSYIAIAAARSGGHIIPGMTLAHEYCAKNSNTEIIFFSTAHGFDQKILSEYPWPIHHIALSLDNVPLKWYQYPKFVIQGICSLCKSFYYLLRHRPQKVILMGGYVSLPVCISALILRIPRELYELNATPGSAAKVIAPIANTIHVCFNSAQQYFNKKKTIVSAYPLRFEKNKLSRKDLHAQLGLDNTKKTILILGGSQGSLELNKVLIHCLQKRPALQHKINIIHQTGAQDKTNWAQTYADMNIACIVFDYIHDLSAYYQTADLIIARAGAGTIFETLFFAKRCILVPLEIPGNVHQLHNARAIAQEHPSIFTVIRKNEPDPLVQILEKYISES